MGIIISNKDIHRYKYIRKKVNIRRRRKGKHEVSFGEILANVKSLKDRGIISVKSVNDSISKVLIKKSRNKKVH